MSVLTRPFRVVESELVSYRRTWRGTVISSFVNPVLFLAAMGVGLGSLVDGTANDLAIPYLTFVATGLMAATAMQAGAGDGSWPVMAGVKWRKEFHGAITTPLGPSDIVVGRFYWGIIRLTFMLVVFAVIAVVFGALEIGPALLAVPPAVVTGLAFQTAVTAFTVTREDETSLSTLFRFGIIPLFLFSGTFFPISQLPDALQWVAYVTPLFHGVELVRKIALPDVDASVVTDISLWAHAAYLVVMTGLGLFLASRHLGRRLRP
ncbi:MAG TPA: ABC transporter permease [Acidimicrobiia bacterium]|nr:ABC transporter permease [Acidimicrobiia bacterium]